MKRSAMILLIFFTVLLTVSNAQKRAFTIEDLYKVKGVGSHVISHDGSKIAFTVTTSNLREQKSNTDIYLMNADGSDLRQLTNNPAGDYNPIWSTDDKGIYFVSTRSGTEQVYYLSFDGGEAKQITDYGLGLSSPKLSDDGKYFVFTANVFPECGADVNCNEKISDAMQNGPVQAHLADSLFIRHWTEYEDGQYAHIFVYDIGNNNVTDITPGYFYSPAFAVGGSSNYNFSLDSKEIVFDSKRVANQESSTNVDIWTVSIDGTGLKNITASNKGADINPKYSPDGKHIAYLTQIIDGYESDRVRLAVYNRSTGESKIITDAFDNWVADFEWGNDSKSIYFIGMEGGYQPLYKIDINSLEMKKIIDKVPVFGFSLSPKNDFVIYSYSYVHKPTDIARYDFKTKSKRDITFFNKDFTDEVDVRPAEQAFVKGADGKPCQVFIVKPHNFDPNKKYPLVINVHGGPQMQWMDSFRGDWQIYPGYGYLVVFPNPHGSTGFGQEYTADISNGWDGNVFEDVMKVTDYLETLPYVDKNRIGAMGWSYGGYFMNLLQARTKRYKCLASMMSIYDLQQFREDTEELWFAYWDLKGKLDDPSEYESKSPSKCVDNFSTPTLIITGERDYRIPYTQSVRYFTVLQEKGIDSRLIVFKNDGHWPSGLRSMPLYYNSHLEWFHKYLGGDPAPWDSKQMVRNLYLEE
ncbi:MAG: peptidase S9 [Ignavibacteria bacterium RBG_13_36_8]|nr:MAG: peptidase S9 [Ignavibacteria bacterium RBG_13_36_8]